ncbi:MAG: GIY-YIG nuclease family protein [Bacteroidota bacterium]
MSRRKSYWTYIMASQSRVLYVGVTNDLARRVVEHKTGNGGQFTKRYRAHRLVYAEECYDIRDAIRREKELKGWKRERKVALIEQENPAWRDLASPEASGE